MTYQQLVTRIRILETRQNCMTARCPLRTKVAVAAELRALRADLRARDAIEFPAGVVVTFRLR